MKKVLATLLAGALAATMLIGCGSSAATTKEEAPAPAPEPPKVEPVSDDPNAQLTPEQIAAMFAQVQG